MSKAFTREDDNAPEDDFDGDEDANPIPPGSKNYGPSSRRTRYRTSLRSGFSEHKPLVVR